MKIGIDIDDTISDTSELLLMYLDRYGNKIDFTDPRNNRVDILRGKLGTDEVVDFIKTYASEVAEKVDIKANAADVIRRLKENGHNIHIVTARREEYMKNINRITETFLAENGVVFDELHMGVYDKKTFCLENGIEVLIDDSVEIGEELLNTDIKPILFTTPVNEEIDTKVPRVGNWLDLERRIGEL